MNKTYTGKKWSKDNSSRIYRPWFVMWMVEEKGVAKQVAESIWDQNQTEIGYLNPYLTEYKNNPVRPSSRFEKYLDLSK
jgi:hypothetical protein